LNKNSPDLLHLLFKKTGASSFLDSLDIENPVAFREFADCGKPAAWTKRFLTDAMRRQSSPRRLE